MIASGFDLTSPFPYRPGERDGEAGSIGSSGSGWDPTLPMESV
jgi:hypothetical protein